MTKIENEYPPCCLWPQTPPRTLRQLVESGASGGGIHQCGGHGPRQLFGHPLVFTSATWIKHTCSRARSIALDVCPLLPRLSLAPILAEMNLDIYVADSVGSPNCDLLTEQLANLRGVFEHLSGARIGRHPTRDVGPSNSRREAMSSCAPDLGSPKARFSLGPGRLDLPVASPTAGWQWARLRTTLTLEVSRNANSRRCRLAGGLVVSRWPARTNNCGSLLLLVQNASEARKH